MFRWNLMLRKLFTQPVQKVSKPQTRCPRKTEKPNLESVEERMVPSAASMNPLVAVASPPAMPSVTAVISYAESTLNQVMVTLQQDVNTIAQAENYLLRQWNNLLGIPSAPNPVVSNAGQQTGSGSGSGSGAMPAQSIFPRQGGPKVHPPSSGTGSGSDAGPFSSNNPATVSGEVWLDNNGDNSLDDGEMGYAGATVHLINVSAGGTLSTTTDANGNYKFTVGDYLSANYQIQVSFPYSCFAALQTSQSQIDANGYSQVFTLEPGGSQTIWGGIQSLNVTTTQDDASNDPSQNQITLRDAMETGDNGAGQDQNRNPLTITFVNPSNQQPVTGTINLQAALPAITTSYDIDGPGSSLLTVAGQGGTFSSSAVQNPFAPAPQYFRIYRIVAGVTSTIEDQTIAFGLLKYDVGGGIYNAGNLTLISDDVFGNGTMYNGPGTGAGGGIFNDGGGNLTMDDSQVDYNTAGTYGGGIDSVGTGRVTITESTIHDNNAQYGGGIANIGEGRITKLLQNTNVESNTASSYGGGIYNSYGNMSMTKSAQGYIKDNSAKSGGGIYVVSGKLTMKTPDVFENKATSGDGGGIYIKNGNVTLTSQGGIANNSATNGNGGGIFNLAGSLDLTGMGMNFPFTIGAGNSANNGGGMYLGKGSTTSFAAVTVSGNKLNNPQNGKGVGIAFENGATLNPKPLNAAALTDPDDPQGPVQV